MTRPALLACLACSLAACDGPETAQSYTIVTVNGRPAVHDVEALRVTLSNSGSERTDELAFSGTFPFTFSISAPDRDGDLGIQIEALDGDDFIVGQGSATAVVDDPTASVMLDSTDFVVNTDVAGDQYPSDDYEAHGFQVAAAADGTWTVAYRDSMGMSLFGRRFDVTGAPVSTGIAAGTNGFPVNTTPTTFASTPAIATAGGATLLVWDYNDATDGIACRSLDAQGNAIPNQLNISTDPTTDVVSIAPLPNSNFAVTWNSFNTTNVVRAAIVRPDCTVLSAPVTASTAAGSPRKATVAAHPTANKILYAWMLGGAVRVRTASLTNVFDIVDTEFLPPTATETVENVRVSPLGDGFAIVVRWTLSTGFEGPGHIDLYRTNAAGAVIGGGATVVSTKSGTDFQSSEAFGVTTSATGKLFITWHACETNGDGQGCGVYGRAYNADGTPASAELTIPTTTVGDQTNPSVAALPNDAFVVVWRDDSAQQPDPAGSAVRARIVYLGGANQ